MRTIQDKRYSVLSVEDIGGRSEADPAGLVSGSEEYYNSQVMRAATVIKEAWSRKFILLCGPSASGKTTTAHKLKHRLIAQGVGARVLSMDNFYMGMERYPKLADGSPDMESVLALDMELLNSSFEELMLNGESLFPVFDFASQTQRLREHHVALGKHDVLIMEGIHALNPMVLRNIPAENIFRIYVSVRTKFVSGGEDILVPKDIRLMRRMARDSKFRNYPPVHTLRYWDHVVASERENIDRYRDAVDLKMDNTIDYEVCCWHSILGGVMEGIDPGDYAEYPQMRKIFAGLMRFPELDPGLIPKNSLLREFIGPEE